jgi:hypothetical protein
MNVRILALSAAAVLAIVFLLVLGSERVEVDQEPKSSTGVAAVAPTTREIAAPRERPPASTASNVPGDEEQRRALAHEPSSLRTRAGAFVTWTPISPTLLASTWDWDEIDTAWWTTSTTRAHADAQGIARPEPPQLEDGYGSVVWVDLPGWSPVFDQLPPEQTDLQGRSYELDPAPPVRVRVLDAQGEPVGGAVVDQVGVDLTDAAGVPAYVPLLFRRTRTADAGGLCDVTRFPGRQALRARHGDLVSRPVIATAERDEVTLQLREGFVASGTVTRPAPPDILGEIVPRITIGVRDDNIWRELATAVSRRDGTWGPIDVPCEPGDAYRALVHGVAVLTGATEFPPPMPGDQVELHLDAQTGITQWFQAHDREEGVPLLGTRVAVSWEEGGATYSVSTSARPDGYLEVLGVRPGPIRAIITKPGYAAGVLTGIELPTPEPLTLTLVMHPGAPVSGRVVRAGEPVPDFELSFWPSDDVVFRRTLQFRDRTDGTFHVEAVPLGPLGLVASAPGAPGSVPLQVDVAEDGLQDVEIELVGAIRGEGRVVRASDGQPVEGATVQPYVSGGGAALTPWGPPLDVSALGAFAGDAFRAGENRVAVRAPGMAQRMAHATSKGGRVDFGRIELSPTVRLRIEIDRPAEGRYRFDVNGPVVRSTYLTERDEEGRAVGSMEDLPEGQQAVELTHPNLDTTFRKVTLAPGPNTIRFRGGSGLLTASLRGDVEGPLELAIETYDERGAWEAYATDFTEEGTATMRGLSAGEVRIYLRRSDEILTSAAATITAGEETLVELAIGSADLLLRVVDSEADPVPGATVRLFGTGAAKERLGGLTNADGEFRFRSLAQGTYVLHVNHPSLGILPDAEVVVSGDEAMEREVVLDGRAELDLVVVDGDVVLPAIACGLLNRFGEALNAPVATNEEGRARIPRLTPGAYHLRVKGDGIWDRLLDVDVQTGAGLRSIEVRRLGDLRMRVVNADGVAVGDAEVELRDAASGESVLAWIESGRVQADGGLVTDHLGEIELGGLPHGAYLWEVGDTSGTAIVHPGKESLALAGLP